MKLAPNTVSILNTPLIGKVTALTNRHQTILLRPLRHTSPLLPISPMLPLLRLTQIQRQRRPIPRPPSQENISMLPRLGWWARGLPFHDFVVFVTLQPLLSNLLIFSTEPGDRNGQDGIGLFT